MRTWYGIRHKKSKSPLGFRIAADSVDEVGHDAQAYVILDDKKYNPYNVWLVNSPRLAEAALRISPKAYNADYEHPQHPCWDFDSEEYEVFEVNI